MTGFHFAEWSVGQDSFLSFPNVGAYTAKWTSRCLNCKYKWLNIVSIMDMDKEGLTARDHKPLFIILHCIVLWWVAVVDYLSLHQLLHCGTALILTWGALHCNELQWMIDISAMQLRCSEVWMGFNLGSHLFNIDLMSNRHWYLNVHFPTLNIQPLENQCSGTQKTLENIIFRHKFAQRQIIVIFDMPADLW